MTFFSNRNVLHYLVQEHCSQHLELEAEPFLPEVWRSHALSDGMEMMCFCEDELNPLRFTFTGEASVDAGGPRQEFGSLLVQQIARSGLMDGNDYYLHIKITVCFTNISRFFGVLFQNN